VTRVEPVGNLILAGLRVVRVAMHDGCEHPRCFLFVANLGGIGVNGIGLYGHGQFVQVAIVENAAARRDLKGALLLLLRPIRVFLMANNLQHKQAACNRARPKHKEKADEPKARHPQRDSARQNAAIAVGPDGCLHGESVPEKSLVSKGSLYGRRWNDLRERRRARIWMSTGMDDLSWLWRRQP
jgi:hypothetical protein